MYTYNSIDNVDNNEDEINHICQEFLQSLTPSGLPFSRLNLNVRVLIFLLCNLYPLFGKYNRTQIIIT